MKVTLIDHMGSDLSVVNAARVSFAKQSDWDWLTDQETGSYALSERDAKLIRYLARHNHWTPFGHATITLHIKAPIFIARQLGKHQTGLVWNEVSRRYVDNEPEFYTPQAWRKRPDASIKQGSGEAVSGPSLGVVESTYEQAIVDLGLAYRDLLIEGVAPEQARMVLPQSMYTEWYWTGSLASFSRVYNLRAEASSQKEVQEIARQIDEVVSPLFPVSWEALKS